MFKDAPAEMGKTKSPDELVAMMDAFGVQAAFIIVDPRHPDDAIALFERFPGRFFGEANVNPHAGIKGVRALEACIKAPPNMKAAFAGACLINRQVPLDEKAFYPI